LAISLLDLVGYDVAPVAIIIKIDNHLLIWHSFPW